MGPGSGAGGERGEGGEAGSEARLATEPASVEEVRRLAEITGRLEAEVRAALRQCSGDSSAALDLLMEPEFDASGASAGPVVHTMNLTSNSENSESDAAGASTGPAVQTMNLTSNTEYSGAPSILISKASNFTRTVESFGFDMASASAGLVNLTSNAKNSQFNATGASAGPIVQILNLTSNSENSGFKLSNEYIDPFKDGYHLVTLFEEDMHVPLDEVALSYAKFCSTRSMALQNKKNHEMCHICFFEFGEVSTWDKREMLRHCKNLHKTEGFICDKKGCAIRTATLGEAGLHYHFCHGQRMRDWWFQYLDAHMNARVH